VAKEFHQVVAVNESWTLSPTLQSLFLPSLENVNITVKNLLSCSGLYSDCYICHFSDSNLSVNVYSLIISCCPLYLLISAMMYRPI
jgi:hypothetical protein